MDWIHLAPYGDRWRAIVNVVVILFPEKAGEFIVQLNPVEF
jgi:hypothetical protein